MNLFRSVLFIGLVLFSASNMTNAAIIDLGKASHYNAFVKADFSATSSDVEGRLAAGGNVSISHYSVNIKHGKQLYTDTSEHAALVSAGDLNFNSGQIAGNTYVGGNYSPTGTGNITNGKLITGGSSPIDFDSEFADLIKVSESLSALTANGTVQSLWSSQYFTGAGKNGLADDLHIFDLNPSDMQFSDYFLKGIDKGDTVILNVAGTDITTSWGDFAGSDGSLAEHSDKILFNFYEAQTLNINAAMWGTILAPKAHIEAPTGVIWGQVIADSWNGNTQINDNPFSGSTVKVPEPSSIATLALALLGFGIRGIRK